MSEINRQENKEPATHPTYQGYSRAFKLQVLAEVENGLISINQAVV